MNICESQVENFSKNDQKVHRLCEQSEAIQGFFHDSLDCRGASSASQRRLERVAKPVKTMLLVLILGLSMLSMQAFAVELTQVKTSVLNNGNAKVDFYFNGKIADPSYFILKQPQHEIVLDFKNTKNSSGSNMFRADKSNLDNVIVAPSAGDLRAIIGLKAEFDHQQFSIKNIYSAHTKQHVLTVIVPAPIHVLKSTKNKASDKVLVNHLTDIDFRTSKNGGAKIILSLSHAGVTVDTEKSNDKLQINLLGATVPKRLQRHLDTRDFSTPVSFIRLLQRDNKVEVSLQTNAAYQETSYQQGKQFIIEVNPIQSTDKNSHQLNKKYTGKPLTLNFQNIEIRSVLQILAEFTGLNIVASDSVKGAITIHVRNIPWDQALDIILKMGGLAERRVGNTIMVAPVAEMAATEQRELDAAQKIANSAPLESSLIQVNYAQAKDIASLLKGENASFLSKRGTVSVDERTNTLWVVDTAQKLAEVREFVKRLDIPVKQVTIKARIVVVDKKFEKELGVRFGVTKSALTGTLKGSQEIRESGSNILTDQTFTDRLNVNLPATNFTNPASIGVALARLGGGATLDLELSALESEGGGEIISSPTLTTSNQKEATIEQGLEIPFEEATSSGATAVEFKKAVLSLTVTPQITPDSRVILNLKVNQDTESSKTVKDVPAINTRQVQTQVLVNNGETIVLGGIYEQNKKKEIERVPFLGDLPIIGYLFRHQFERNNRDELLIFITPQIIKQTTMTHT